VRPFLIEFLDEGVELGQGRNALSGRLSSFTPWGVYGKGILFWNHLMHLLMDLLPALEIQREELGHLSVGPLADIAVLRVEKGKFGFVDSYGARMACNRRLLCELTIHDGIVVYDLNGITRDSWDRLGDYQPQGDPSWDGTRSTGRKTR